MTEGPAKYVLITAARNEEELIEAVIESVLAQSVRPARWIIVSDGSTDRTDEIVKKCAAEHEFIELLRTKEGQPRDFASKVFALQAGFEKLQGGDYDFIGNLDGDITLPVDYYEKLLMKFAESPRLGVAGGGYDNWTGARFERAWVSADDPPGGAHLFRRACWEQIGGYRPIPVGGEDSVAAIQARMHGWQTQTFEELRILHHRPAGSAGGASLLKARMSEGRRDYHIGMTPLTAFLKCLRRLPERPAIVGSVARTWGWTRAWIARERRRVPPEVIRFVRREHRRRLRNAAPFMRSRTSAPRGA